MDPSLAEQPESEVRAVYPPPPNVQWIALFGIQIFFAFAAFILVPKVFANLAANLVFDVWIVYLCLWLRKLNPEFMSIFWCSAYIALQLSFSVPGAPIPLNNGFTI